MARPLRIDIADGLYHMTSRGWQRRVVVRDDRDRQRWRELLERVATRCGWRIFAWTLLDNHVHLYLRTPQPNLSAGMHDLNSGYASFFNRRHRRCGALLQGRFKAVPLQRQLAWRPSIEGVVEAVGQAFGVKREEVLVSRRHGNDARLAAVYLARQVTDEAVGAIARCFGGVSLAAISKTVARVEQRRAEDKAWDRRLAKLSDHFRGSPPAKE
jgi:REP element-mobilizing transposase RayT